MSLISVIIPMRNAEAFIRSAIESVLAQRGVELEVIVVDDGSTDQSVELVRAMNDPRVCIVPGPRTGISDAFNTGLAAARGEFVARCDADDLYPPARLAEQAKMLESKDDFGAICGYISTISRSGKLIAEQNTKHVAEDVTDELRRGVGRSHMCAYLYRASVLREIGGCRSYFVTAEDADLQFRLAEVTRVWYEPKPAYLYRLHDASITHVQHSAERAFFESMAREFQMQRQSSGKDDLMLGRAPQPPTSREGGGVSSSQQIQRILLGKAWAEHAAGRKSAAVSNGIRACLARPGTLSAWKSLAALVCKSSGKGVVKCA